MSRAWAMGVLGVLVSACGIERLDAGSVDDGAPASSDAGKAALWPYGPPSNSFNLPCTLPAPPELAGTWQGQFDSYQLPSGTRAIRLDITGAYQEADGLCGTITFGQGTPPPIATDPAAPAPGEPAVPNGGFNNTFVEGFPYEFDESGRGHVQRSVTDAGVTENVDGGWGLFSGGVDGNQIEFHITERQPLKSWCNLQSAYWITDNKPSQNVLLDGPKTSCVPPSAFDEQSGANSNNGDCGPLTGIPIHGVSCTQALYCYYQACDCESSDVDNESPPHGCTVVMRHEASFSLALNGSSMSGNLTLGTFGPVESLELTRLH